MSMMVTLGCLLNFQVGINPANNFLQGKIEIARSDEMTSPLLQSAKLDFPIGTLISGSYSIINCNAVTQIDNTPISPLHTILEKQTIPDTFHSFHVESKVLVGRDKQTSVSLRFPESGYGSYVFHCGIKPSIDFKYQSLPNPTKLSVLTINDQIIPVHDYLVGSQIETRNSTPAPFESARFSIDHYSPPSTEDTEDAAEINTLSSKSNLNLKSKKLSPTLPTNLNYYNGFHTTIKKVSWNTLDTMYILLNSNYFHYKVNDQTYTSPVSSIDTKTPCGIVIHEYGYEDASKQIFKVQTKKYKANFQALYYAQYGAISSPVIDYHRQYEDDPNGEADENNITHVETGTPTTSFTSTSTSPSIHYDKEWINVEVYCPRFIIEQPFEMGSQVQIFLKKDNDANFEMMSTSIYQRDEDEYVNFNNLQYDGENKVFNGGFELNDSIAKKEWKDIIDYDPETTSDALMDLQSHATLISLSLVLFTLSSLFALF